MNNPLKTSPLKVGQDIIKKYYSLPLLLLCYVLLMGYVIPTIVYGDLPYGTDAFTHLIYTKILAATHSLDEFYKKCLENNFIGYDYPFGLWMFGSIVSKITGLGLLQISLIVPFGCLSILIFLYYNYSKLFYNENGEVGIFSILFLLSTPSIAMSILGYSTSIFAMFIDVAIIYFLLNDKINLIKRFLIMGMFVFFLSITHTGTYLFVIFFSMALFVVYAAIAGKMHREFYFLPILVFACYFMSMSLFPEIHSQYIGKGKILVSIGEAISLGSTLTAKQIFETFYDQILVKMSVSSVVLWMSFLFLIGYLMTWVNRYILRNLRVGAFPALVPASFVSTLSHSPLYWPIWLGPVNVVLAVIGVLRTRKPITLSLVISVALVTIPSGIFAGERALRELFYMFLIVPVLASIGYVVMKELLVRIESPKLKQGVAATAYLIIFLSIVVLPVVGNLYYHPDISGSRHEINSLRWLAGVGGADEGAIGPLGSRVAVYGNKIPVEVLSIPAGSEMSRLGRDEYYTYFRSGGERYTKDLLASFGINYLIITDKIFRIYGETPLNLTVDSNTQLDKIYSSINYVSIYRQIPSKIKRADISPQINFVENVSIEDAGGSYLVDTGWYRVRLSKETPEIQYIRNKTENYLGEGGMADILNVGLIKPGWASSVYALQEISYSGITLGNNQIVYRTTLKSGEDKNLATLIVKYTFFERAFKKEIIVANDWSDSYMRVGYTARIYSPLDMFTIKYGEEEEKRRMYPNEDYVLLKDTKFSEVYIHHNGKGILIRYDQTAPYPNKILYTGSVIGYYMVDQIIERVQKQLSPSETLHITQWISAGSEETAEENVNRYSISIYPFSSGIKPLILVSYLGDVNSKNETDFIKNVHEALRQHQVTHYFEIVSKNSKLNITEDVIYTLETPDLTNVTGKIEGFFPKDLKYDLKLLKLLETRGTKFVLSKEVPAPYYIYWKEGVRLPQFAFVEGRETSLVLIPISKPIIGGRHSHPDVKSMMSVIDASAEYESVVIFRWDSRSLNDSELLKLALNVLEYAKRKGLTISSPYEIAEHFKLLKNVSVKVSVDDANSQMRLTLKNGNDLPVYGLTIKINLPPDAKLQVENADILYQDKNSYYIAIDLMPGEVKAVKIKTS